MIYSFFQETQSYISLLVHNNVMIGGVSSRHLIESSTPLSIDEIEEVEDLTGLNVDHTFDRVVNEPLEEDAEAKTELQSGRITLKYEDELLQSTFAHEAAHAEMMYPDGDINLPGENPLDQRIYSEFVARLSESLIEPVEISSDQKMRYQRSKSAYREGIKVAEENGLPELDSMHEQWRQMDCIENDSMQEMLEQQFWEYQTNREQILAGYAASSYMEENQVDDVRSFINPDENMYREVIEYMDGKEDELLG